MKAPATSPLKSQALTSDTNGSRALCLSRHNPNPIRHEVFLSPIPCRATPGDPRRTPRAKGPLPHMPSPRAVGSSFSLRIAASLLFTPRGWRRRRVSIARRLSRHIYLGAACHSDGCPCPTSLPEEPDHETTGCSMEGHTPPPRMFSICMLMPHEPKIVAYRGAGGARSVFLNSSIYECGRRAHLVLEF